VRPLLDYCSPVRAPVYKTDINLIEQVQRRFIKRLLGRKDNSYHDRLVILDNVDILEIKRCSFFGLTIYTSTRVHYYKLVKLICNNNARQFPFACRHMQIDAWNDLPVKVVNALSLSSFKNFLRSCFPDRFVKIG